MFPSSIYKDRRNRLRQEVHGGLIFFPGNQEVSFNYLANTYAFRQDSSFLYFFGQDQPDLAGVMDLDTGKDILFGNDVEISDIIWMGQQPSMKERSNNVGVADTRSMSELEGVLHQALSSGRKIHYLPPYRGETIIQISELLALPLAGVRNQASEELIRGVVKLRMKKDLLEIQEMENMVDVAWLMHTTAMKMARPGTIEKEIAGTIEGIALSQANGVSFPIILTINGQTLHNHYHGNILIPDRMLVVDAGAESEYHYASDITRTAPVGGEFSRRQKDIYAIVLAANLSAIKALKPGVPFRDIHLLAALEITRGLTALGIMKGNVDEAVSQGAHTMFFPHGLGHPIGLDVHDLEGLGENFVGYDKETERSKEFGLGFLRFGRKLQEHFVMTIEPGIYFIPELIDLWKAEGKHADFINYDVADTYRDFGGIRIEDNVLITDKGSRVLGKPIPKTVSEIEEVMAGS
ncbi:MAG: aminopeptidase P family protein [Bacteroidetes bacterium]|nr:MAG: aminopeptidase P family protein [Bacteroidota bacterium]